MRKSGILGKYALSNENKLQVNKTLSEKQNSGIQHLLDIAVEKHTKGNLEEASDIYRHILHVEPNHPATLQLFHEIISGYKKALIITPNDAVIHCNLGVAYQELGRLDEAVSNFQKALAIDQNYPEAHYNLAVSLQKLGYQKEPVIHYRKATELNSNLSKAHNNLGVLLLNLGNLRAAEKSLKNAVVIDQYYSEAYNNLGLVLHEIGIRKEALACFQKALSIKSNYFNAFSNMYLSIPALCHDIQGKRLEISYIEEIIDSLPTPPEPDILRLLLRMLTGGDTGEAWDNVVHTMPSIPSETILNDNRTTPPPIIKSGHSSQRRMVALLHFGRSGSGYLHSLLDDHPNISTLPGVYMSGFFGREVWERVSRNGFQKIPERFSSMYKVLFDARNPEKIPPAFISDTYNNKSVGEKEGFVKMGLNQDTPLTLDRGQFLENLSKVINSLGDINHGQFFESIHHAYETTLGRDFSIKSLIFYHLHKIDPYSLANFLKYFPSAELLMIIRNPLQSCESWALKSLQSDQENKYKVYTEIVQKICPMLTDLNHPSLQIQDSAAVRLEDIKEHPKETMGRLCGYLGIEEAASLYDSTMQGLKWWGDPSSSLFGRTQTEYNKQTDPTRTKTGTRFTSNDQFILNTLFYPFSARFGYVEKNDSQFRKDLEEIRPLIDAPLDFEKELSEDFLPDYPELELTEAFKNLHAVLLGSWQKLGKYNTYPYMIKAMPEITLT